MTTPTNPAQTHRAFLALDLPESAIPAFCARQQHLKQHHALSNLRWIPQSNWHLTLIFLGNQTESLLDVLWQQMVAVITHESAVAAPVLQVAGFPDATSPILAALVEPTESLLALQSQVQSVCGKAGVLLDRRRFKPHITLARATRHQVVNFGIEPWHLAVTWPSLTLYSSELTPHGSLYTPLHSLTLR